jgi:streptomycin 6-kinase
VTTPHLQYRRGSASARVLQAELDAILAEMSDEPCVPHALIVSEGGQGADPMTTTIIITVIAHAGAVATHATNKIFDEIVLPKLKDRFAQDALGAPVEDDHASENENQH